MVSKDKFVTFRTSISPSVKEQDVYFNKPELVGYNYLHVEAKPYYADDGTPPKYYVHYLDLGEHHAAAHVTNLGSAGHHTSPWSCPKSKLTQVILRAKYGEHPVYKNLQLGS